MEWQTQEMRKFRKYKQIENTKEAMEPYGGFVVCSDSEKMYDSNIIDVVVMQYSKQMAITHQTAIAEQLLEFIESYSDMSDKDVLGAVKTFLKEMRGNSQLRNK